MSDHSVDYATHIRFAVADKNRTRIIPGPQHVLFAVISDKFRFPLG